MLGICGALAPDVVKYFPSADPRFLKAPVALTSANSAGPTALNNVTVCGVVVFAARYAAMLAPTPQGLGFSLQYFVRYILFKGPIVSFEKNLVFGSVAGS